MLPMVLDVRSSRILSVESPSFGDQPDDELAASSGVSIDCVSSRYYSGGDGLGEHLSVSL